MRPESSTTLAFADGPKLELDELIDELVERAHGVKRVQGRLRALLRAIEMVNDDLSLDAVLRHLAEAARLLVGARYGALSVIGTDGGLDQFVHVGTDEDPSAGVGPLLDVAILVRGEAFGNLHLTGSDNGAFSAEDEELVRSLALAAGAAIANARLYDDSRRQQRWLTASVDISARLLADTDNDPMTTIAHRACDVVAADLVSISLVSADGADLQVAVAVGAGGEQLLGRRLPQVDSVVAAVLDTRTPVVTPRRTVVPLPGKDDDVLGVLEVFRRPERPPFRASELAVVTGFAGHVSVALEFARNRADQRRIALLEDRDRIARDLHDHVIQQLFAIGLSLEGLAMTIGPEHDAAARLADRVEDVDRTIRQIRTSIFELHTPATGTGDGLRTRVLEVAADLTPALGFAPQVTFAGQVDLLVDDPRTDDLVACVREALTNVAKHARARRVDIEVQLHHDQVQLTVSDDGTGMPAFSRKSGLDNLRARAENRGGAFTIRSHPATGTDLTWKVPLR